MPLHDKVEIHFLEPEEREPRTLIVQDVFLGRYRITLASTHLTHLTQTSAQLDHALRILEKRGSPWTIFAGDLNIEPSEILARLEAMNSPLRWVENFTPTTVDGKNLDHVLLSRLFRTSRTRVYQVPMSDHDLVLVDVQPLERSAAKSMTAKSDVDSRRSGLAL